jgi:hypothetical protein
VKAYLGQFDPAALAFVRDALEAADIEYLWEACLPDPLSSQRLAEPSRYEVLVETDRLADAKAAIERWQKEAEDAVMRESDAPPPSAEELAADAEWEKQKKKEKAAAKARRSSPVWPGLIIIAAVGGFLAWLLAGH